jgi:2-polyprenyl-6-methoxyphenol hydroxylase-like FAD-dependent oxidoreductase
MDQPSIMIIGAGVGGLCLAQGLRLSGVPVNVFERDQSGTSPVEGYRLSISATGSRAFKACLPQKVSETLAMRSAEPSRAVTFLDHRMNRLLAITLTDRNRRSVESEHPISRTALRRVLLEGLDDIVHFGKTFVAFEDGADGRVTALFSDGSRATADVLVGADGANSHVRSQLLPEVKRADTGIVAVRGKLPLDECNRARFPEALLRGPTPIMGPQGCFLFVSAVAYDDLAGEPADPEDEEVGDREAYLMWGFSARRERFGGEPLERLTAGDLKRSVERLIREWHPDLRRLVEETDPGTIKSFSVKTSTPVRPWRTRNVTLLGDALHNMPPYRGVGANSALWDAALLRETIAAQNQDRPLVEHLAAYERRMIKHGFRAVRASLATMAQFHSENLFRRTLTKAFLRTLDHAPPLQAMIMAGR